MLANLYLKREKFGFSSIDNLYYIINTIIKAQNILIYTGKMKADTKMSDKSNSIK